MDALIVTQPFIRVNPISKNAEQHLKGDQITAHLRVFDILGSEHEHHVVKTQVPDDHVHDAANTAPAPAAAPPAPAPETSGSETPRKPGR